MPDDPASASDDLNALVAAALHELELGGESGLQAYLANHRACATAVASRVDSLRRIGLAPSGATPAEPFPERLGDFELRERIGSGGMGVVYRARQVSLDREVALKLIRPEHLYFPGARERFQREIQAVARLRHDAIVQLHCVGEDNGVPWFAMERVVGANLAEVLERLRGRQPHELGGDDLHALVHELAGVAMPSPGTPALFEGGWVRVCCKLAEAVAQALVHAHAQGVLHRDVKPSNVMVTPAGRVVLMDFGLASMRGTHKITRTGAVLGSLHYMAPEAVAGDVRAVDERSDVYSLGATLYELLTLQAPFGDSDEQRIQQRILSGALPSIGSHNSAVPWDAETVCLCALDRQPQRRYPSALALQRDLRAFLDLRPIGARRPSASLRAVRWCQRHPAVSAALAVAALALVLAPLLYSLSERRARVHLEQVVSERDEQWRRARANLSLATSLVGQVLERVGEDRFAEQPELQPWCSKLLDDAAGFLTQLSAVNVAEPELTFGLAQALQQVGGVRRQLGDLATARAAYLEMQQALLGADLADGRRRGLLLADAELALASLARQEANLTDARAAFIRVEAALGSLPASDVEVVARLAAVREGQCGVLRELRETEPALAAGREAVVLWERVTVARVQVDDALALARSLEQLAAMQRAAPDEAAQLVQQARTVLERARVQFPADPRPCERLLLALRRGLPPGEAGVATLRAALVLADELLTRFPARREPLRLFADLAHDLGRRTLSGTPGDEAELVLLRAVGLLRHSIITWPRSNSERGHELAILVTLARHAAQTKRDELAHVHWHTVAQRVDELLRAVPELAASHQTAQRYSELLAREQLARGDLTTADQHLQRALAARATAERLAPSQRLGLTDPLPLECLAVELALRRGDEDTALRRLRGVQARLPNDLLTQVPALADVAHKPEFAALLTNKR